MAHKLDINFENDIVGIDRSNIKEKVLPYINELVENLLNNNCQNVRIATKIRKLTNREAEVYITLRDIDEI